MYLVHFFECNLRLKTGFVWILKTRQHNVNVDCSIRKIIVYRRNDINNNNYSPEQWNNRRIEMHQSQPTFVI